MKSKTPAVKAMLQSAALPGIFMEGPPSGVYCVRHRHIRLTLGDSMEFSITRGCKIARQYMKQNDGAGVTVFAASEMYIIVCMSYSCMSNINSHNTLHS